MRSNVKPRLSSQRLELRWKGHALVCGLGIGVGLICATASAASASTGTFEVGQRWEYRHEGPRPGSTEPNAIDGERILWVVSSIGEPGATQWSIEERFTKDEKVVGCLLVDGARLLNALEIRNEKGEKVMLRYDPPVPYRPADMNVGETREIETTLRVDSAGFSLPNKTVVERLADESISTPAGEFTGCSHFRSTTTSIVDIKIAKIPVTEEREQWYHPSVRGMVKEVYRKGPVKFLRWSRPGYTATSTLTAYGKQDLEAQDGFATQMENERGGQQEASHPPIQGTGPWSAGLILAGVVAFGVGALVLKRRVVRMRLPRPQEKK